MSQWVEGSDLSLRILRWRLPHHSAGEMLSWTWSHKRGLSAGLAVSSASVASRALPVFTLRRWVSIKESKGFLGNHRGFQFAHWSRSAGTERCFFPVTSAQSRSPSGGTEGPCSVGRSPRHSPLSRKRAGALCCHVSTHRREVEVPSSCTLSSPSPVTPRACGLGLATGRRAWDKWDGEVCASATTHAFKEAQVEG